MGRLVLLRHGESMWNHRNVFTGWVDVPLSEGGIQEAMKAGEKMADMNFDVIYVSTLVRAMETAMVCMAKTKTNKTPVVIHQTGDRQEKWAKVYNEKMAQEIIPVYCDWHLNERYYGELQGMNKDEMREQYGKEQVHVWRRSFDTPPPNGEALRDTAERTLPFFKETIMPLLEKGQNILISAHGNSLRSIVMHLDSLSPDEVVQLEIPTGAPMFYEYQNGTILKVD